MSDAVSRSNSTQSVPTEQEIARAYLEKKKIPQMFESLLSSLMMEKPEDHLSFLEEQLEKIKEIGPDQINWETFIHHLHPYRDPIRKTFIQDGKYEDGDKDKGIAKDEPYEPHIFNLTEESIH